MTDDLNSEIDWYEAYASSLYDIKTVLELLDGLFSPQRFVSPERKVFLDVKMRF